MFEVRKRSGFSDRNGIKNENIAMQFTDLDERTRNRLIAAVTDIYNKIYARIAYTEKHSFEQGFCCYVLTEIYSNPVDHRYVYDCNKIIDSILETIEQDTYDSVFTLIESLVQYWSRLFPWQINLTFGSSLPDLFNKIFEEEYVGYRFVGDKITKITDQNEIAAIKEAMGSRYKEVNLHLEKALDKLSDRKKPDYENSIKESITAVEALCEVITNTKGSQATLGSMLKKLEDGGVVIHGALKDAFIKLYGYTSDANGIRHAGDIGGPSSTFEEAKFMLASCSAFINYLKTMQAKIK